MLQLDDDAVGSNLSEDGPLQRRRKRERFGNAIYAVYLTGKTGVTIALLLFHDGVISGADFGEGMYDGEYRTESAQTHVVGTIKLAIPAGSPTITGVTSPERNVTISVPFELSIPLDQNTVYRIETELGPVNARFKKVRDI